MKTVYLAGPILGCTGPEANEWRGFVSRKLGEAGIQGISPLRCEPIRGERYTAGNDDPKFGTARAIGSKNFFDVQSCDMTLCYLPLVDRIPAAAYALGGVPRHQSYGTLGELFWANALRKPTILVTNDPELQGHPVVQAAANWSLTTLDEAVEVLVGILGAYV